MRTISCFHFAFLFLIVVVSQYSLGQTFSPSQVKENNASRITYPFSDPNPIANSNVYPYFRFDIYGETPVNQSWKVVQLENAYLKLDIYPEIGGKVWNATVKKTGRSFLFDNPVVKFRDVAIRGPWTSGGMELNFGIVGHSPHSSAPVDYLARKNPDGSASCFIAHLDLMTRTTWTVEINLPADSAGFVTKVHWHNGTPFHQPYYSWMNLGIGVSDQWQTMNPGTIALGHGGEPYPWPTDDEGRDITHYRNNDYGTYKSYHIYGKLNEAYGYYDHGLDSGMAAYVAAEDRRGRKVWIWGLSREGMIWEDLLTDPPGTQYLELQAGRLYIQNAGASTKTPFKHYDFAPLAVDCWEEHWMPVDEIGGFVTASPYGSMNVQSVPSEQGENIDIAISPAKPFRGRLHVLDGEKTLYAVPVDLKPLATFRTTFMLNGPAENLVVKLDGDKLCYRRNAQDTLSRPVASPEDFDWSGAYGKYVSGCESMRQRQYQQAKRFLNESLEKEPYYVPALARLAEIANMEGDFDQSLEWCHRALSIDTYDPETNYQFALASIALKRYADAREAASLMSLSPGHRGLAFATLARIDLIGKKYDAAVQTAEKALDFGRFNPEPLRIQACALRLLEKPSQAQEICRTLKTLNPLDHFSSAEAFLSGQAMPRGLPHLTTELPQETYLELAAWYRNAGRDADAVRLLELSASVEGQHNAETFYWLAWLKQDADILNRAKSMSPMLVFPFRTEAIPVFQWAVDQNRPGLPENDWKSNYYLALLWNHLGKPEKAKELFKSCGDTPDFAPFYIVRADWLPVDALRDISRAVELDPDQWRYGVRLSRFYNGQGNFEKMLETTTDYLDRFPTNDQLELLHAQALIGNKKYEQAIALLQKAIILPNEGGLAGRNIYREATLLFAAENLRENRLDAARHWVEAARQWPENLGSGKPYQENLRENIENWLQSLCDDPTRPVPSPEEILGNEGGSQTNLVKKILEELKSQERE